MRLSGRGVPHPNFFGPPTKKRQKLTLMIFGRPLELYSSTPGNHSSHRRAPPCRLHTWQGLASNPFVSCWCLYVRGRRNLISKLSCLPYHHPNHGPTWRRLGPEVVRSSAAHHESDRQPPKRKCSATFSCLAANAPSKFLEPRQTSP